MPETRSSGEPDVGNLHLRFDEGRGVLAAPSYSTGFHEKAWSCQAISLIFFAGDSQGGGALLWGEPRFVRRGANPPAPAFPGGETGKGSLIPCCRRQFSFFRSASSSDPSSLPYSLLGSAHPASFPPGPRLSGGIRRSTAASITAASSAVKNIQGPGRTITGGVAVPASHGRLPLRVRARAKVVPTRTNAAADANNERRDGCEEIMRCMVTPRA